MGASLSSSGVGRMREVLGGYVERGEIPGLVALVARHGDVHVEALGTLGLENDAPVAGDTIFRISSMTKPVVAAAAMILVEECRVRLDDPVDEVLPELADRRVLTSIEAALDDTVPAHRPITLRDLLTFRMGLGLILAAPGTYPIQQAADDRRLGLGPPNPAGPPEPDEWMRRLGELPLVHQPGEGWMYSLGSDVLGVLVARVAGQDLETFLRERIFDPLGMSDTSFSVPAAKLDRFTTHYAPSPGPEGGLDVYDRPDGGQWSRPPAFPAGAGGLVSTAQDYLAFGRMMLNKGTLDGTRILAPRTVETMTTNQLGPALLAEPSPILGPDRGWGFGLAVVTARDDISSSPGAYGWDGGMGSSWRSDPAENLVGIILTPTFWPIGAQAAQDFWTTTYVALAD